MLADNDNGTLCSNPLSPGTLYFFCSDFSGPMPDLAYLLASHTAVSFRVSLPHWIESPCCMRNASSQRENENGVEPDMNNTRRLKDGLYVDYFLSVMLEHP